MNTLQTTCIVPSSAVSDESPEQKIMHEVTDRTRYKSTILTNLKIMTTIQGKVDEQANKRFSLLQAAGAYVCNSTLENSERLVGAQQAYSRFSQSKSGSLKLVEDILREFPTPVSARKNSDPVIVSEDEIEEKPDTVTIHR